MASGRRLRVLAILDTCTREAVAIEVATSLPGVRVVQVLDNGPELTSRVLDHWAYQQQVRLQFIDPGKPIQNAFIENFNSRLRDECLNIHWFTSLADAQLLIEAWRLDYNRRRPHSALSYQTPEEVYQKLIRPFERSEVAGFS